MIKLIQNEMSKVKSEKFIVIIILLSLIPFIMNLANFFINDKNLNLTDGFYFRFYNQYFMLSPICIGVIGASIFYIEFKNHTFLNWIAYSNKRYKLFLSKVLVSLIYWFLIYILNLLLLVSLYSIYRMDLDKILYLFMSFSTLNIILTIFMIPLSIFTIIVFNNYIVSLIITIAISMISMILIPAPFANIIPTTLGYRLGLSIIDVSIGFENSISYTTGIFVLLIISTACIIISIKNLKVK
ncbi:ABC transporter permease [Staphylococcus epidermidis]|uniref:ABC transporter permease n=1 Tax=Staphylococcus epidermidis TaxID=1282 RepID=UPI000F7D6022|nr:ABC transporter permease [Staphylococcus epidermidis]MCG1272721.1 ABC transporter permease [Staphylococcus epidermidis]RTE16036.1 hypothetical protein BKL62_04535 [Staphylococcus epidermidis]RTE16756.1 hypothetical protein BKL64_01265 [Staphylococcus epidermidis]RTE17022.1 hypothetical protein BKL63_03485 [Staphylococcus epidermidis]RTE19951.1 hypothetical protein BKL71_08320 [Staphylococcus epidermidis]